MRLIISLAVALASVFGVTASPASAQEAPGNSSIFFYNGSTAVTGTLHNGDFVQRSTFSLGAFTHAAASRDSLLLYNANTGAAQSGSLVNGLYVSRANFTLEPGFTNLTASCDSYLLYRRGGYGVTGTLTGGRAIHRNTYTTFRGDWQRITSSCDTVLFWVDTAAVGPTGTSVRAWGTLVGGTFSQTGSQVFEGRNEATNSAATADSMLLYQRTNGVGAWFRVGGGQFSSSSATSGFAQWDMLAGTSDTVLFYNRATGAGAASTVVGGTYSYKRSYSFSAGWTIIAGGK